MKAARNKPKYYAEQLYESMKGAGTRDDDLIMLLVTRSERDLKEIKDAYYKLYQKQLTLDIKKDLSGDYEKLFLELVDAEYNK